MYTTNNCTANVQAFGKFKILVLYATVGASLIGLPFTPYIGTLLGMRFTAFCRQVFGCKGFLLNGTKLDLTKIPPLPPNELAVEWSDLKASKTALLQINQAFNISL